MGSQGRFVRSDMGESHSQGPKSDSLAKQGSIYGLTFDEVQHHLGNLTKQLSSMDFDEFLQTVRAAEANLGIGGMDFGIQQHGQLPSALNQQPCVILSRDMNKKTVDEVWQEIQKGQNRNSLGKDHERQPSLGEMTVEDFLVEAGVVAEPVPKEYSGSGSGIDPMSSQQQNIQQQAHQPPPQQLEQQQSILPVYMPGHPVQLPIPISSYPLIGAAFPATLMGTLPDTQTTGRKRFVSGDLMENTIERRQKRMMKNRESAARSRSRKQAYILELENKISRLREENGKLQKQKDMEKLLSTVKPPERKDKHRRYRSAPPF